MTGACVACGERVQAIAGAAPGIERALRGRAALGLGVMSLSPAAIRELCSGTGEGVAGAARSVVSDPGIEAVCRHDAGFPAVLFDLDQHDLGTPALLHLLGGFDRLVGLLASPCVTIVGARRASSYALRTAHEIGRGLAAAGVTVISGLALGVDAAAHAGAIEGGGPTLAVVAGGVDVPYPSANAALRRKIIETGVVISEMPPGTPSFRWGFPARNRLMAALGRATLVVECGERSGTLITVRAAQALERSVLVTPGRIDTPMAAGSNNLLREACVAPVLGVEDILDELFGVGYGPRAAPPDPFAGLDPQDRAVLEAVMAGKRGDEIAEASGGDARATRGALGRLELDGRVERDGLGWRAT